MVKFGLKLILETFNVFFLQSCGQVNKGSARICCMEKGINQGSEANEVRKDKLYFVFFRQEDVQTVTPTADSEVRSCKLFVLM